MSCQYFTYGDQDAQAHCTECEWFSEPVSGHAAVVSVWSDHLRENHPDEWLDC